MPSSIEMRIRWTDEQALSRHFAVFSAQATEVGHRGRSFMTALESSAMLAPDGPSGRLDSTLMGVAIHDLATGPEIFFGLSQRLAAARSGSQRRQRRQRRQGAGLAAHRFSQPLRRYSGAFSSSASWLWRLAVLMQEIARELDILCWRRADEALLRQQ